MGDGIAWDGCSVRVWTELCVGMALRVRVHVRWNGATWGEMGWRLGLDRVGWGAVSMVRYNGA